jgi:hypothetical protein
VDIDRKWEQVSMVVDYEDSVDEADGAPLSARIRLEWSGVSHFEMPLGETDILFLRFGRKGDRIMTEFETSPGIFGTVISERVEAYIVRVDPGESHSAHGPVGPYLKMV